MNGRRGRGLGRDNPSDQGIGASCISVELGHGVSCLLRVVLLEQIGKISLGIGKGQVPGLLDSGYCPPVGDDSVWDSPRVKDSRKSSKASITGNCEEQSVAVEKRLPALALQEPEREAGLFLLSLKQNDCPREQRVKKSGVSLHVLHHLGVGSVIR